MWKRNWVWVGILALMTTLAAPAADADGPRYILRSPSATQAQAVCQRYGMEMLKNLGQPDLFLVEGPDDVPAATLKQWLANDPDVQNLELNSRAKVAETSLAHMPYLPTSSLSWAINDKHAIKLFGANVWVGYVQQPAMTLINAALVQQTQLTGTGIIAIIDTGVDPRHPALSAVLLPGYDFTRNLDGSASELRDLDQSTAAILEQSTSAILEQSTSAILEGASVVQLNQSTAAILEQSTAAILEGSDLPAYFGHGTMVAGLVHLVAPQAKILPLKAFRADGTSSKANIIRAIYYAADHGAKVINMSFSIPEFSDELMRAVNYAARKGAICVASVGNEGVRDLKYPAALGNVVGVASTTMDDQRSMFSNFGNDMVTLAAPGEALVTTYPGGHYAAVWGTSFSSALVAGGASVLYNAACTETSLTMLEADALRAFSQAATLTAEGLGAGRLDLNRAAAYIQKLKLPPPTSSSK